MIYDCFIAIMFKIVLKQTYFICRYQTLSRNKYLWHCLEFREKAWSWPVANFVLIAYTMRRFTRYTSRFMIIYRWITLSNCALITQMRNSSNYSTTQCLFLNRQVWRTYFNILFSRKTLMSSCVLIWPMKNFNNFSTIKCLSLNRLNWHPLRPRIFDAKGKMPQFL